MPPLLRLLAALLWIPLAVFSNDPDPDTLHRWVQELGADDFQTRNAAEEALVKAGPAAIPLLKPLVHSDDPEVRLRATRILRRTPLPLQTFFANGGTCKGEAREGDSVWPCIFTVTEYDPDTGAFSGTLEWTTLNALHKIEGTLAPDALTFRETEHIRRGNAMLDVDYTLSLNDHDPHSRPKAKRRTLRGTWSHEKSRREGPAELTFP